VTLVVKPAEAVHGPCVAMVRAPLGQRENLSAGVGIQFIFHLPYDDYATC
jgi:hypothetical protein